MKKNLVVIMLVILGLILSAQPVLAETFLDKDVFPQEIEEKFEGSVIGIGYGYADRAYEDVDPYTSIVPLVVGEYKNFFVDGRTAGYIINKDDMIEVSVLGNPRFEGYHSDDSSDLVGMEDRKWSFEGGVRATLKNDLFDLKVTGLTDLLGNHEGQEISAILSREFFEGAVEPRIGVRYYTENYMDYYFGVKPNEATAVRPNYEPDGGLNYIGGIRVAIPLGEKWAVIGDVEYTGLSDEIQDSPIVKDDNKLFTAITGLVYRF